MAYTTIKKPSDYFNTVLYTGNGSTQSITGVGFTQDFTWIKSRSTIQNHYAFDTVRGAQKQLYPSTDSAEDTGQSNGLNAFTSDGFNLGTEVGVNGNGATFASWNWKANGTASSNTDGSITSTVSANTTSGFSIVSYTGTGANATIGHGLSAVPKMIIVKKRSVAGNWYTYHQYLGNDKRVSLNLTNVSETDNNAWNQTTPTSSVFSVGPSGTTNASGTTHIAYCFAEKQGFSKFGSYVGNGSTDGTFIYTGFKPAFVILKRINISASWSMWDNERGYNGDIKVLYPDLSSSENNGDYMDFVSNGIKLRDGNSKWGASGDTYIYMAFAEEPLVGDNPATAR